MITRRHLAVAGAGIAAVAAMPVTPAMAAGEEAAVAEAVDALRKAMLAADKAQLEALVVDQLSYGHSDGRVQNKAQFVEEIVAKNSVFRTLNFNDQTVTVVGTDAIVRNVFQAEMDTAGRITPVRIGVLQVWQKQAAGWKLLARQAVRI